MTRKQQIESKLHDLLAYELDCMIDFRLMDYTDKDRLRYAACFNDAEKLIVTQSQIKKMQKKLDKCDLHIAGYISALIIEGNSERCKNYEQLRKDICYNFLSDYIEEIEQIAKNYKTLNKLEKEDTDVWREVLKDETYIFITPDINNFIKFMVVADRLETYKSFLDKDDNIEKIELKKTHSYNNQNFTQFIKDLEYNYPIYHTPVSSYHQWQTNLKYLKIEILENLIILTESSKNPYLSKLEFELNNHLKYCHTLKKDLVELYDFYETTEKDVLKWTSLENELHIILNTEPSKYEEIEENNYKMNPFVLQEKFYNYHYYFIIKTAIYFISIQKVKYGYIKEDFIETMPVFTFDSKNEPTKKSEIYSFTYNNTDSTRLTDLMKALKFNNLIASETQLKHFRKIFSGEEIDQPVIWTASITELAYFVKSMHKTFKKILDTKQQHWEITTRCFIQQNGKQFDKTKFRGQKPPASKETIEKIVQIL